MNKKTYKNLILAFGLIAFVFLSCDKRPDNEKWMAEIRYFIMIQADDFDSYQAIDFQQIDTNFLMSNAEIQKSLMVLQDTTRTKLKYYGVLESTSPQLISKLSESLNEFPIDYVDEFLFENARLDKALRDHYKNLPETLLTIEAKQQAALSVLNRELSAYGLSIYNINLTDGDAVFYYHTFQLQGNEHAGVFELNKETMEVESFKEITVG